MEEAKREFSSEEDMKIATLILGNLRDLGFNDPSQLTMKEREKKYSAQFERICREFNDGKNTQQQRTFYSFCNRFNMIVRELRILKSPNNTYKDKGRPSSLYHLLEEILMKSPNLGVPSETDVDQNDISAKTSIAVVEERKLVLAPSVNTIPVVRKTIRNDAFAGISKTKAKEEKKRKAETPINSTPSMKRVSLLPVNNKAPSSNPVEVDLYSSGKPLSLNFARKVISPNFARKMIHTEEQKDYPILDESSSLDSTLSDDDMGGLESMPHVVEMQNENRKQKESGMTDSQRVDMELEKREKEKKERIRHKRGEIIDESFSSSDVENDIMDEDIISIEPIHEPVKQPAKTARSNRSRNTRNTRTKVSQATLSLQPTDSSRILPAGQSKPSINIQEKMTNQVVEQPDKPQPLLESSPEIYPIQPPQKPATEHQPILESDHPFSQPIPTLSSTQPIPSLSSSQPIPSPSSTQTIPSLSSTQTIPTLSQPIPSLTSSQPPPLPPNQDESNHPHFIEENRRDALESSLCADLDTSYSVPVSGPVTPVQTLSTPSNTMGIATRAIPPSGLSIPNDTLSDQFLSQPLRYSVNYQSPLYLAPSTGMMSILPTQKQSFIPMTVQPFSQPEEMAAAAANRKESIASQMNESFTSPKLSNAFPAPTTTPHQSTAAAVPGVSTNPSSNNQPFASSTTNPSSIALPPVNEQYDHETDYQEDNEKVEMATEESSKPAVTTTPENDEQMNHSKETSVSQQVPLNGPCYCSTILMCNCNVEIKAVYSSSGQEEKQEDNVLSSILHEVQCLREEIKGGGYSKDQMNELEKRVNQIVDSVNEIYHSDLNPM